MVLQLVLSSWLVQEKCAQRLDPEAASCTVPAVCLFGYSLLAVACPVPENAVG